METQPLYPCILTTTRSIIDMHRAHSVVPSNPVNPQQRILLELVDVPFQTYEELLLDNLPPPEEYIGEGVLLRQSKLVLFGSPKLGKSIAGMQMAMCLSAGISWLGFPGPKHPVKVAYLQCEVPKSNFRERVIKMSQNAVPVKDKLHLLTDFNIKLDVGNNFRKLDADVASLKPEVLVLDPLYKIITTEEERVVRSLFEHLDYLIDKYGLSVILVAHDRKPKTDDQGRVINLGGAELRGSRLYEGWFESIIKMEGQIHDDNRVLHFELRHGRNIIPAIPVKLDRQKLWFVRR